MDQAMERQAVAEWRDRHIIAAATLINFRATEARTAFDKYLAAAGLRGPMLDAQRVAAERIDLYMRERLSADLDQFLSDAAKELAPIDERLSDLAEGLRLASIAMPEGETERSPLAAKEPMEDLTAGEEDLTDTTSDAPRFTQLTGVVVGKAAWVVKSVGSGAAAALYETSGAAERLRKAGAARIEQVWMSSAHRPEMILSQMIHLIDGTAHAARVALS